MHKFTAVAKQMGNPVFMNTGSLEKPHRQIGLYCVVVHVDADGVVILKSCT